MPDSCLISTQAGNIGQIDQAAIRAWQQSGFWIGVELGPTNYSIQHDSVNWLPLPAEFQNFTSNSHFNYFFIYRVAELVDGKGGGRKGRFQGKANKLSERKAVEKLLQDHYAATFE